jgi:hypothetical protein
MGVRHRLRQLGRRLRRRGLLVIALAVLLLAAWVVARWLASTVGGFPADPPGQ